MMPTGKPLLMNTAAKFVAVRSKHLRSWVKNKAD
jgi:hypothetical protein